MKELLMSINNKDLNVIAQFLQKHQDLLNACKFNELYQNANDEFYRIHSNSGQLVSLMTNVFYKANLDILKYMTAIPDNYLAYDENIKQLIIPKGMTSIGYNAFYQCVNLYSITIPNTVKYIDDWALSSCNCLNSIIFTGTVKQWNRMKKHERWNKGTNIQVIHCSNGDIDL